MSDSELDQLLALLFGAKDKIPAFEGRRDDRTLALAALAALGQRRATGYHSWLAVDMALHTIDPSPAMCDEWDRWSRNGGEKYQPDACTRKWASFGRGTG